jgi:hypothetical protein
MSSCPIVDDSVKETRTIMRSRAQWIGILLLLLLGHLQFAMHQAAVSSRGHPEGPRQRTNSPGPPSD